MGQRQDYRGAAAALALTNDLSDTTSLNFAVTGDTSGWPSGASGRNFAAVIDRGTAKEEKVLCSSLASGTMVLSQRGYDGTTAKTHSSGAAVEHYGISADKADDLDAHAYDPTRDDHTQYVRVDGSRGFTGVDQLTGTPSSVGGTNNLSGSANTFSRSDHAHAIAQGGIDDSGMFADNVVTAAALGPAAVGNSAVLVTGQRLHTIVLNAAALATLTPQVGDTAYQTDIAGFLEYQGPTNGWTPPWNTGWGEVATPYQNLTGGTTATTGFADMSGGGVTFTAVTNRRYRITGASHLIGSTVAGDICELELADGSGQLLISRTQQSVGTTAMGNATLTWEKSYTAGSQTVTLQARRLTGTGTFSVTRIFLGVVDLGPNGLPS